MFSKYLWRYSCIMKSTGSVVTHLIFEFSSQHVLFTCIRYYVCIVHILCMKMHNYFLLNIKHGASQLLAGWFQWTAYRKVPIGYRLGMIPMTSRDPMTSKWRRHDFFVKCFFSGIVWSSRIVYPGLMTSLQRAKLIAYWLVIGYSSTSSNFDLWSSCYS